FESKSLQKLPALTICTPITCQLIKPELRAIYCLQNIFSLEITKRFYNQSIDQQLAAIGSSETLFSCVLESYMGNKSMPCDRVTPYARSLSNVHPRGFVCYTL